MKKRFKVCIVITLCIMVNLIFGVSKCRADNSTITFSDNNLYSSIKSALKDKIVSFDDEKKSIVMTDDARNSVSFLYLDNKNISSLDGIENFTNLSSLSIEHNHITQIGKIPADKLYSIGLSYVEEITDLELLANYGKLTTLNVSCSALEDIPEAMKNLHNLTNFEWEDGSLKTTAWVDNFQNLTRLSLKNNKINNLANISILSKLTTLDVSFNEIENIEEIGKCNNLTMLYIASNRIKQIDCIAGLKLVSLYAQNNNISDIACLNMDSMKTLDVSNNCISNMETIKSVAADQNFEISGQFIRMNVKSGDKVKGLKIVENAKEKFQSNDIELLNCKIEPDGNVIIDDNVSYARIKINDGMLKNTIIFFNVNNVQVAGVTEHTVNLTKTHLIIMAEVLFLMMVSVLILAKIKRKKK